MIAYLWKKSGSIFLLCKPHGNKMVEQIWSFPFMNVPCQFFQTVCFGVPSTELKIYFLLNATLNNLKQNDVYSCVKCEEKRIFWFGSVKSKHILFFKVFCFLFKKNSQIHSPHLQTHTHTISLNFFLNNMPQRIIT